MGRCSGAPSSPVCASLLRVIRLLVLLLCIVCAGAVGYFSASSSKDDPPPDAVVEVRPSPSVIQALRRLSRLEGASLHLERVVDLKEKQSKFFGLVEAEDAILLVAAGDVTAGVDLSKMSPADVSVDEKASSVRIVLPRAEIFSSRVDNDRTYVHTRRTDLLAEHQAKLESAARKEAEQGFVNAAIEAQLTETAEASVARTVHTLVTSLGFREVEVVFVDPDPSRSPGH